jgi:cellulose biosynthesis protein BcsQ
LLASDLIITPVGDSSLELHGLLRFASILRELGNGVKANVVINRVHPFSASSIEALKEDIRQIDVFRPLETVIRDRADYKKSFGEGKTVGEYSPNGAANAEIVALVDEIKELLLKA